MSTHQKNQQYKMRFLDNEDHEKLKLKGKEEDRSINWLINQAIKEFLNKESAKKTLPDYQSMQGLAAITKDEDL